MQTTRPRYVTKQNRQNEQRVVQIFADLIPATQRQVNTRGDDYDADVLIDGKLACICEVKGRKGDGDRFDTWHLAADKLKRCAGHAARLQVPFFLLFSWDSKVFYWKAANIDKLECREGGRWDRGDAFDVETMVHIPRSWFTRIA